VAFELCFSYTCFPKSICLQFSPEVSILCFPYIKNNAKERYQGVKHILFQGRGLARYIKLTRNEKGEKQLTTELVDKQEAEV